jgi:hypothetical protein
MLNVRAVNRGIDTLVINMYYINLGRPIRCDIDEALAAQLNEWKHMAQKLGEPCITRWVFNNASLQMQPNRAGHGLCSPSLSGSPSSSVLSCTIQKTFF